MKKRINRRDFLRLAGGAAAGAALAACQPKTVVVEKEVEKVVKETVVVEKEVAVAKERTPVSFWHFFSSGASRDAIDQLVGDYNVQAEDYVLAESWVDFGAITQKCVSAIAAGDPPDLWTMTGMTIGSNVDAGQVMALDAYIDASDLPWDQIVEYGRVGVTYDGKPYGVPWLPDTRFLFMNAQAMREVGLDPMDPPKTWNDLKAIAPQLDEGAAPNWERVGFNPMWGNCWVWTLAWTNETVFVDENNNVTIDSPEMLETAYFYKHWVDHYGGKENLDAFAAGFGSQAADAFMSGMNPMQINGVWYPGNIEKYTPDMEVEYAMVPVNKSPGSWGCGHPLAIPTGAPNPDGGWDFIDFASSFDASHKFLMTAGRMVGRIDVMEQQEVMDRWKHWKVAVESLKVTKDRAYVKEVPNWASFSMDAIREVWDGAKTPEQALADAQAAVDQEIENYKKTQG